MIITRESITTGVYLFLVVGGLVTLAGSLIAYFNRKPRRKKRQVKR